MAENKKSKIKPKNEKLKTNKELEELRVKCQEYLNGWQRAQADYENLKKETEKRVSDLKEYVEAGLILDVLPIYDHYKLALSHVPEGSSKEDWVIGFLYIKKDFTEFFKQFDIEEIKTVGEEFNPEFHEAVGQEESEIPENQIIKEVSSGYKMNSNILRPAKVIVSKNNKESQSDKADISGIKE